MIKPMISLTRVAVVALAFIASSYADEVKHVLSFGGSDMIGSVVLKKLLERGGYNITMVARGTWRFHTAEDLEEKVNWIPCDRSSCMEEEDECENALEECEEFMEVVNKTEKFDYVLDFSGFEPEWVQDALNTLGNKIGVYIFLSSHLVYEVCEVSGNDVKTLETEAVRPSNEERSFELIHGQPEGDGILDAESYLQEQRSQAGVLWGSEAGVPWVSLRCGDVIGPMDSSYRWPLYQLWLTHYHELKMPFVVPEKIENVKQSLTYSEDAARAVLKVMDDPTSWDNVYNIAFEETFTLWGIIQMMAKALEVEGITRELEEPQEDKPYHYLYPTVVNGPLDISKAKSKLGFKPTKASEAFQRTADWYHTTYLYDDVERATELGNFMVAFLPSEREDEFFEMVAKYLDANDIPFDSLIPEDGSGDSDSEDSEDSDDEEL